MLRILIIGLLAVAGSACLRTTQYMCSDTACGANGVCEASGFCSFPDGDCASGRSYGESAGALSGTCTEGTNPMIDMNTTDIDMEMQTVDMMMTTDMNMNPGCPSGYVTVAGGTAGHMYKIVTATDNWQNQQDACVATTTSAYLFIPDDLAELQALNTAASNLTLYWIGVSDSATEDEWRTVKNALQTFLPWDADTGAPDDAGPGEDCVQVLRASNEFNDERCNTSLAAICECAP